MVIEVKQKVVFEGLDADENRLDAYRAAQSLEGLVWALSLTLHFGITGKVRGRGDLSSSARIYVSPPRRGSFINELNILVQDNPALAIIVGGYAVNTVTPFVNSLIAYTFNTAMGVAYEVPRNSRKFFKRLNGRDWEKVVKRIEPPLTRAHTVIGKTADVVTLKSARTEIAQFNLGTKAFLEARLREGFHTIDTNVTSFNVLTGNGRLYDPDQKQTVPFSLSSNVAEGTVDTLTGSMHQYSLGRQGLVRITAQRVEMTDGRLKQLLVSSVDEIPIADWDNGVDPLRALRA